MPAMSARTCMSILALLALLLSATIPTARAQATDADAACRTAAELLKLQWPLTETRARLLRDGAELRVLTVGSSSTQGHGASGPEMTYPAQLSAELTRRHPALRVSMHNIGAGGTDVHHAIARMEQELPELRPHMVIWQVGANDAIRGMSPRLFADALDRGLRLLRTAGAEVLLLPPQFAPRVLQSADLETYLEIIDRAAETHRVAAFRRFEIGRAAAEAYPDPATFLIADGLHHNDLGYRCLALQIAAALEGDAESGSRQMAGD